MGEIRIEVTLPSAEEIANGAIEEIGAARNQREAAEVYASAIRLIAPELGGVHELWARINAAITTRWPKGLQRVKTLAWKIAEERERQSPAVRP